MHLKTYTFNICKETIIYHKKIKECSRVVIFYPYKTFLITKENLNGTCLYMAIDPTNIRKLKKVGIDGYFDLKEHN